MSSICLNCLHKNNDNDQFCQQCRTKLVLKDRYRALSKLGNGAFGRTFKAKDQDIPSQPLCVIKQFFPEAQGTSSLEKAAELFSQEAERLDSLGNHPQIPTLLAHFSQEGRQYLIQQFIDGCDLEKELAISGAFKEDQIRQFLGSLLPVLDFIHSKNVIHRDIKPPNIIKSKDNQWFLVDFGAAKLVDTANLSAVGTRIGTPGYTAPEQNYGKALPASDIYSLGATCVHLLTNKNPLDLFDAHESTWQWRKYVAEGVSDDLATILDKMLSHRIKDRFYSAQDVLDELTKPKKNAPGTPQDTPTEPTSGNIIDYLGEQAGKIINKIGRIFWQDDKKPLTDRIKQLEAEIERQATEYKRQIEQFVKEFQLLIQQLEAKNERQSVAYQHRIEQLDEEIALLDQQLKHEKNRREADNDSWIKQVKEKQRLIQQLEEQKKRLEAEIIEAENQRLLSGKGNYMRLRDLLAKGRWQEADKETTKQMLNVGKRKNQGWLNADALNNFPSKDLKIIDQLWVKYSKGKFGFSVQRKIWLKCGGKVNYDTEEKLAYRLGWIKDGKWIEYQNLTFDPRRAARGHFPSSPRLAGAVKRWQVFLIMLSGFILLGILCAICLTPVLPYLLIPLGITWETLGVWVYVLLLTLGICIGFSLWWLWWLPKELCASCVILARYSRCL
jgi:serine/threonine protein kinase